MIHNHRTHKFSFTDGYIPGILSVYFTSNVPHLFNSQKQSKTDNYESKVLVAEIGESTNTHDLLNFKTHGIFCLEISPFSLSFSFHPDKKDLVANHKSKSRQPERRKPLHKPIEIRLT